MGSVNPVRQNAFHPSLVQGGQCQGVELPGKGDGEGEGHHSMPPPGQPGGAGCLVHAAGLEGQH
eukprot:6977446-Alexandrium_andersonii.AAC.1